MVNDGLVLQAVDVDGPLRWRWLLLDGATDRPVADHQVELNPKDWRFQAFAQLDRYLRANAAPDRRLTAETAIVDEVGAWAAEHALGERVSQIIFNRAPVTVTVAVPETLRFLPDWPWEITHAAGRSLARHHATFDYVLGDGGGAAAGGGTKRPVGATLRVLAVFSQPSGTSPLALRRERRALVDLVRRLIGSGGYHLQLRVLQYGVTRDRLRETVEEEDGWDLLHLSCHGTVDTLVLESDDGQPDAISTTDLIDMLRPSRHRVKLAVLSACQSAAADAAQVLRWLGLDDQADHLDQRATAEAADAAKVVQVDAQATNGDGATGPDRAGATVPGGAAGLGRGLVEALGCAVLAMRYPVGDEFAIRLTDRLYDLLLDKGRTLDTATGLAVAQAAGPAPTAAIPPACLVTPVLLGPAADLRLRAPAGAVDLGSVPTKIAYLPPEPERFVGRVATMTRASAALAPRGRQAGVLFHGMAGAGKTACALELAHQHADHVAGIVYWSAPDQPDNHLQGIPLFATALETQLGLPIADKAVTAERLTAYLPTLAETCARTSILFVLDNLETLLGDDGRWRDPRWPALLGALTGRRGLSRVVLTSRIRPAGLDPTIHVEQVHALPLAEAALLARELPGLRALLHADDHEPGALRADRGPGPGRRAETPSADRVAEDRALLTRTLNVVQGHPKLLELADAAANEGRAVLAGRVAAAEEAASTGGRGLAAFFTDGESALDPGGFLAALADWVDLSLAALSPPALLLVELVCGLEDDDRELGIIEANWADVWSRLGRSGEAPGLAGVVAELEAGALVAVDRGLGVLSDGSDGGSSVGVGVHPGVAEAVRVLTPPEVRRAVDVELAAFWHQLVAVGLGEGGGGERGWLVVRAGVAAAPYLLRLGELNLAASLLEEAFRRSGGGPGVVGRVLPLLAQVAETTGAPKDRGLYGRVLGQVDPVRAEGVLRGALAAAVAAGDHRVASAASGDLVGLLRQRGRLREALAVAEAQVAYTAAGGLGPWTQADDEGQVLQLQLRLGDAAGALADAEALLARLDALPDQAGPDDTVEPWSVREMVLQIAAVAALALGRWEQQLDLSARMAASMRTRGASEYEVAETCRFGDYGPLLRLGRYDEADVLLADCQRIFTDAGDLANLGRTFFARADLAAERGRPDEAVRLGHIALRLEYSRPDPVDVATSHHNLANYLTDTAGSGSDVVAHRLAAALLYHLTGIDDLDDGTMRMLATDLVRHPDTTPPDTVTTIAAVVEQVDGVHWADLVDTLTTDRPTADQALHNLITTARALATEPEPGPDLHRHLAEWEPVIAAIAELAAGGLPTSTEVDGLLDELDGSDDWANLSTTLRRVLAGERNPGALLTGLDAVDTAIATTVLDRIATPVTPGHPAST
ncbi:CHAT domain-containing protein [Pseudofrankia saprophytica]|uniref:CHAT domain-containing protein n=1 Tax=Pseudofrankia saprophytica TaxID=298655 RepID=UPI0022B7DD5B|nr:CHAT domain-containing protein [Pseudofrankia saprophytica]